MPSAAEECCEPSGKCDELSGKFTLSGEWSPCKQDVKEREIETQLMNVIVVDLF